MNDVFGRCSKVVRAVGDVAIDVALFAGAAIAFHVDGPADKPALREPVHRGGIRPVRNGEIESRLRRHRRAVDEEHCGLAFRRVDILFPQEEPHVAVGGLLLRPVLDAGNLRCLVHRDP